ncbi:CHAT domain-containing protein [Nocardioides pyridinolyticus]
MRWVAARVRLALALRYAANDAPERAKVLIGAAGVGSSGPLDARLMNREAQCEVAVAGDRRSAALKHLRSGLSELHAWQSSFGSLDLQTGVAGQGARLAARGLALALETGRPDVLFEWSERARMLASRVQPVRAPEDEQIVADLTELREMTAEGGRRDPEREAVLRQRVRERAWQHRGSGEVVDPVTLAELRAALDGDTALVAYVVAADRVVALAVTTAEVAWADLGERAAIDPLLGGLLPDLDMAASELPGAMAGFVRQELAQRLFAIAEVLVAPVLATVGDRRVVLTPSGVLAGVPWTLLPGFTGRPLTVAQSATSWLVRRRTPLRSSTAGFVAGPRVARAEEEVTAAAKEWSAARVLTGDAATAEAVSELASSVDVLHVAAHGRHTSENAMFSGLQLADGPWFGYDIDQLRQVPDVVVLSACEVGRSTVRWGDELIGMTTAWLHAGARRVVASPAAINDQAAYDVLVALHQQLASGVDPAAALATAVPAVSADTAPVPLVCFG